MLTKRGQANAGSEHSLIVSGNIASMASVEARSSSQLSEHAGSLRFVQPYQAAFGRLLSNLFERKARKESKKTRRTFHRHYKCPKACAWNLVVHWLS